MLLKTQKDSLRACIMHMCARVCRFFFEKNFRLRRKMGLSFFAGRRNGYFS